LEGTRIDIILLMVDIVGLRFSSSLLVGGLSIWLFLQFADQADARDVL